MRELFFSLGRRWYLVVVALALTIGACFLVSKAVPADYESKASLVLLPPKSSEDPTANRFLGLQQLGQATGVVIRALNGDDTHRAVAPQLAGGSTYTVEPDYTTNAPILVLTATSRTNQGASALITAVEAQVPNILTKLQDGVSTAEAARIIAVPLTTPEKPALNSKKQLRAVVAAGVGLVGILALVIGAVDGYLIRRSLRQPLSDKPALLDDFSGATRPVDLLRAEGRGEVRHDGRGHNGQPMPVEVEGSFDEANLG